MGLRTERVLRVSAECLVELSRRKDVLCSCSDELTADVSLAEAFKVPHHPHLTTATPASLADFAGLQAGLLEVVQLRGGGG